MARWLPALALVLVGWAGCAGDRPAGLRPTPPGSGPLVVWDLDAEPLPEIPFPNDLATRADPSSPTGRRLDIPLRGAVTRHERLTRERVNRLEGFATFGTIAVAFDEPLDLGNIIARHHHDSDPANDTVLLINVDPRSRRFGEQVPLDLGQGSFPEPAAKLDMYWERDPRRGVESLIFDTTDEDANGNGQLDPGEDTDSDGYLDVPNMHPVDGDPLDDIVSFYERVTRTLLARPLVPLEQETRYAVVLTRHLRGEDGEPVRSPWAYVNHGRQTAALDPLRQILPRLGLGLEDVAFAWSFTTQGPTRDLEALRAGLYGHGPLARLAQEFPAQLTLLPATSDSKNPYLVPTKKIQEPLSAFSSLIKAGVLEITPDGKQVLIDSLNNVEYFVVGEVTGPNLLVDRDGDGGELDEVWEVDRRGGSAVYASHAIPFMCAIPRADRGQPPFPVAVYAHGYGSTRLEMLAFAGNIARYGIATCTIDAVAHGLKAEEQHHLLKLGLTAYDLGPLFDAIYPGRGLDANNDGLPESGDGFVSADLFNTRDNIRQTVLDILVLIRALRSFDGVRRSSQDLDGDGQPEIAGDFDADGRVDLAGPDAPTYTWGTSLGGITSAVVAGVEPAITAASPQAVGGGLVDIARRTDQSPVRHSVVQRLIGPILVGRPTGTPGEVEVRALATSGSDYERLTIAHLAEVAPGDRVELENLANGERHTAYVLADGGFHIQIPADAMAATERRSAFRFDPAEPGFKPVRLGDTRAAGDRLELRLYAPGGDQPKAVVDSFGVDVTFEGTIYPKGSPLVALCWGYGLPRNSPDLRRLITLAQMIIDPADPINYAPHYQLDPLVFDYDEATPGTNVLVITSAGDTTVPVSSAVSLARAAGAVSFEQQDPRFGKTPNRLLIDSYVVEGLSRLKRYGDEGPLVDPEDFSRGVHAPEAPRLAAPLRLQHRTAGGGLVAIRIPLLDPKGQHGFLLPKPSDPFDNNTFMVHLVGRFLSSGGTVLEDDPCMASASCSWIPPLAPPHE
jgi:hypothetical protein